ncbi:hypothetical protein EV421DRAFT_2035726 [Armillaria borealis]|uniref:Uncharacterized protein n=1 Tax=Armillaria borealis TaxID=47425 RepID=A0AA39MQ55_9AGAR|nr:hypothetical protein EV421DRAFT_2035726 [Armillaria borealis]
MAILRCQDSPGRIVKEGPWTFDPETGRCVRDETYLYVRPDPDDTIVVYSTSPPLDASAPDVQGSEQYMRKLHADTKPCTCREGCYLRWSGVGGCGCANNGGAWSVLCRCGAATACARYTPPPDAGPINTSCTCVGGCLPYRISSG